jgi:hypothetical protein
VGAGALVVLLADAPACTLHDCDPTTSTFPVEQWTAFDAGDGEVHLASGPFDGTWLDYPGGVTITVNYPAGFVVDQGTAPTFWVSTGSTQDAGAISTSTAGQLDELSNITSTGFLLNNKSCAEYYVWFSVTGTFTGTTTGDAGAEAGVDASHE